VKPTGRGRCPPGYFLQRESSRTAACRNNGDGRRRPAGRVCRPCTACPPGVGAVRPCGRVVDAVCRPCMPGATYADLSSSEQPCLRCTQCSQFAVVERTCSVTHDAVCRRCRRGTRRMRTAYSSRDGNNYDSTSIRRAFDVHSTAYERSLRSL